MSIGGIEVLHTGSSGRESALTKRVLEKYLRPVCCLNLRCEAAILTRTASLHINAGDVVWVNYAHTAVRREQDQEVSSGRE